MFDCCRLVCTKDTRSRTLSGTMAKNDCRHWSTRSSSIENRVKFIVMEATGREGRGDYGVGFEFNLESDLLCGNSGMPRPDWILPKSGAAEQRARLCPTHHPRAGTSNQATRRCIEYYWCTVACSAEQNLVQSPPLPPTAAGIRLPWLSIVSVKLTWPEENHSRMKQTAEKMEVRDNNTYCEGLVQAASNIRRS